MPQAGQLFGVDLGHHELACGFIRDFDNFRRDHLARAAPGRPEIHQDRQSGAARQGIESQIALEIDRLTGRRQFVLALSATEGSPKPFGTSAGCASRSADKPPATHARPVRCYSSGKNPKLAVTRVKERPGFQIRNKFKSSDKRMTKTDARFEFSFSNIRSLFRASDFEFESPAAPSPALRRILLPLTTAASRPCAGTRHSVRPGRGSRGQHSSSRPPRSPSSRLRLPFPSSPSRDARR